MVEFRSKMLTVMGSIGYAVALLLIVIDVLPTFNVPLQSIFIVLGTSSVLLGVDFGVDVLWTANNIGQRPIKPDGTTALAEQHTDDSTTAKQTAEKK